MNWALESRSQVQGVQFWLNSIYIYIYIITLYELSPGIQVSSSRWPGVQFWLNSIYIYIYITLYELSPGIQVSSSRCAVLVKFYIYIYICFTLNCMNWALESRSQVQGVQFWLNSIYIYILHCMNLGHPAHTHPRPTLPASASNNLCKPNNALGKCCSGEIWCSSASIGNNDNWWLFN